MLQITKHSKLYLTASVVIMTIALVLVFSLGLNLGIDFVGGALVEYQTSSTFDTNQVRELLNNSKFESARIQTSGEKTFIVKLEDITQEDKIDLENTLSNCCENLNEIRYENIGPSIGKEVLQKSWWQILLVLIGILIYITYSFRKISISTSNTAIKAWKMGAATIFALLHDILIPAALFAILGFYNNVQVDTYFITALLTILGFSVHDTIVVFDRIRENLIRYKYKSLETIIDYSINTTLARSINTSSTLIFVLLALLFFGGSTTFYFTLALLVGVVSGTYSSIFVAGPMLLMLTKSTKK